MRQLSIIPCGKKKIWDMEPKRGATQARYTYIGTFHTLCRSYVRQFTDQWVVLSAKHGYLLPEDFVDENYDVTFNQKSDEIITFERLQQQVRMKQLDQYDELVILTGKKYKKVIEASFPDKIAKKYPLAGYTGMGYMQQALKNAILNKSPIE